MGKLLDEARYDLLFLRSHTLQPRWWKMLKAFVLLGFLIGHAALLGLAKTVVAFLISFVSFCLLIHLAYRSGTRRNTRSWLDFSVGQTDTRGRMTLQSGTNSRARKL